jgi:tetratricopeptide (TPR) repeat protein
MNPLVIMMRIVFVAILCGVSIFAADLDLQKLDEQITTEMESLIDNTGKISENDEIASRKLVQEGTQEHDKGEYRKAIDLYEKAIKKNPLLGIAYYEIAYSYSESGEQRKALEAVMRSLVLNPKMETAYIMKASILDDLGLSDDAIAAYRKIIEIKPDSLSAHLNLGITLYRKGDYDSAKNEYLKAQEIQPNHPSPYLRLSQIANAKKETYEEERYLNEFVRVGKNDPRLPAVQKRLKELTTVQVNINVTGKQDAAGSAHMLLSITEGSARSLWQKEKHRKAFPDAKAYFPSFEEEKDVLSVLLPIWKEQKAKTPAISMPEYDFAVAAEKAGYLDEFLWYMNRRKLGTRAESWIKENTQKVNTFTDWAVLSGFKDLVQEKSSDKEVVKKETITPRALPALLLKKAEDSKFAYVIGDSKPDDVKKFQKEEGQRFHDALKKSSAQCISKDDARKALNINLKNSLDFSSAIQIYMPGDEEWNFLVQRSSNLGRRYRDLAPPASASGLVGKKWDKIFVQVADPAWIAYYLAKALWRYEPGFRQRFGGSDQDKASIAEEEFALAALAGSNQNHREPKDGKSKSDPYLDKIEPILGSEDRIGFVLLEILHKTYGASLECLPPDQINALQHYFYSYVLEPVSSSGK